MPIVSIIVPVYKTEQFLPRCIKSIIDQSYSSFELLLIDDGNTDNCGVICDNFATNDTRIRVFHKKNEGASIARMLGIRAALGEFLFFVDSDDYIEKDALSILMSESDKKYDIIIGNMNIVRKRRITFTEQKLLYGNQKKHLISSLLSYHILSSLCGRIIRKNLFDDLIILDELKYGEDSIIMFQIFSKTNKILILKDALYYYVQHKNSAMHTKSIILLRSRISYMKWIITFIENFNIEYDDLGVKNSLGFYIINEFYSFLLNGGKHSDDQFIYNKVYNFYLTDKILRKKVPSWRLLLLYLYKLNPTFGKVYCKTLNNIRYLVD